MGADAVTAFHRASVMVGAIETSYQRAGHGAPVLLLVPPPRSPETLLPLVTRWRVIVPESTSVLALPETTAVAPFTAWLRGFLEGLGLQQVAVVADIVHAVALATVQAEAPGLVGHVEFLGPRPVDWQVIAHALHEALGD